MKDRFVFFAVLLVTIEMNSSSFLSTHFFTIIWFVFCFFVFFKFKLTLAAVLNGVSCYEGQQGAAMRSEGGGEAQGRHLGGILGSLIGGAAYGYGYPGQYGYVNKL